jgi:asparagine synthase (glutamine-hydrolysing)
VAALAQRHVGGRNLQSFSIAFDDPQFDESRYARIVAQHIGSRHVEQTFSERSLLELIDEALDCLDEPMADPSILPTYALSKLASKHVKVVLGGDGGDELWAGYPTYKAHRFARLYESVPRRAHALLVRGLDMLPASDGYQSLEWKAKRFVHRWDDDAVRRHLRWMSNTDLPDLARAIDQPAATFMNALESIALDATGDQLNCILALDFQTYLPGSVLTKVDRASMAHGLEVRPPMLGNAVIDFAFSLPSNCKLHGATTKVLLKRAAQGVLPDEIIHRRKKGFAIPLSRWLNGPLRARLNRVLAPGPLWGSIPLRRDVFIEWAQQHRNRRADRSKPLWALIVLDHWFRGVVDAKSYRNIAPTTPPACVPHV